MSNTQCATFLAHQRAYQSFSAGQADEHGRKWTEKDDDFVHFHPVLPSSVCGTADENINACFLEPKSRTSGMRNLLLESTPNRTIFMRQSFERQ
jgi:hypothetical protein